MGRKEEAWEEFCENGQRILSLANFLDSKQMALICRRNLEFEGNSQSHLK